MGANASWLRPNLGPDRSLRDISGDRIDLQVSQRGIEGALWIGAFVSLVVYLGPSGQGFLLFEGMNLAKNPRL